MLKSLLQRAREARAGELGDGEGLEEGFTLIELMVVLLIIAILLAIAIPTFLGVTNSASDRAAQSNLTNGLTEAKAIFQNTSSYYPAVGATQAQVLTNFSSSAPEFSWVLGSTACTTNNNCMSEQVVDVNGHDDGQGVIMATYSAKDSECWYALDLEASPQVVALGTETGADLPYAPTSVPATASTAGVFYAKKSGSANCKAGYPQANSTTFLWGPSYGSAGSN